MAAKLPLVLSINPGSTSTKVAVYEGFTELFRKNIEHDARELAHFSNTMEQMPLREKAIMDALREQKVDINKLDAVAGRGGPLPPVKHGAYRINKAMVDYLAYHADSEHASKMGAILAFGVAEPLNIPSYIYDSIRVDEADEAARFSGLPDLPRKPGAHVLNMRAAAIKTAEKLGRPLDELNLIVGHLGGGTTLAVISKGRMIDYVGDDEGPFSPERAGRLPYRRFIQLCYSGKYDQAAMLKHVRGKGGLMGYLGTNSALEVEARIDAGDVYAESVYRGMAYQIAKAVGELATVVKGDVDGIILTGGVAHSKRITGWVAERVGFIAPVEVIPGENELESLAYGIIRVLQGREKSHEFAMP